MNKTDSSTAAVAASPISGVSGTAAAAAAAVENGGAAYAVGYSISAGSSDIAEDAIATDRARPSASATGLAVTRNAASPSCSGCRRT